MQPANQGVRHDASDLLNRASASPAGPCKTVFVNRTEAVRRYLFRPDRRTMAPLATARPHRASSS
jgi:hypothetical protein